MFVYDIPFEIFSRIAIFLSTKDKIQCILTCKAWKSPFQDVLWDTISILNREKIREICDQSTQRNIYRTNGKRVKTLIFGRKLSVSDQELCIIQRQFMNLQSFCAPDSSLSFSEFGQTADWNNWRALKDLEIYVPVLDKVRSLDESLKIISNLPSLRRLEFTNGGFDDSLIYSLQDMETLHAYLPKLEFLSIDMILAPFEPKDMKAIESVTPADGLTCLDVKLDVRDYRWLYYFGHKYRNLRTLSWDSIYNLEIDDSKDISTMFSNVSPLFPHLRSISVSSVCCSERRHLTFWRIFDMSRSPIKNASCLFTGVNDGRELLEEEIEGCMKHCSETLEKLSITCDVYAYNSSTISLSFSSCPHLVELYLDIRFLPIEFDTLLDRCTSLRSVRLSVDTPSVSSDALANSTTHGVVFIEFISSKLDTSILHYISFRCRNLHHLRLCDVLIYGPISQENGNIYIDMSYTNFEVLHLDQVHFYPSNKPYCMMNGDKPQTKNYLPDLRAVPIRLLELSQQKKDHERTWSKNDNGLPLYKSTWFHTFHYPEGCYPWKSVRILKKREVRLVRKYFKCFQRKSTRDYLDMKIEDAMIEMVQRHEWKKNMLRGYVTFKCGYMDEYRITGHTMCNDALWKRVEGVE
ncbi:hypothetical protein CLU79DRAFT_745288 [Phycomyces nitens]|nr:hypothetical protein CLU79DRAFT_745288 [Phycomyces nitens]